MQKTPPMHLNTSPTSFEGSGTGKHGKKTQILKTIKTCPEKTPRATIGTPKIYTTTGLGPRKNREMAGVDDLVVYMQTAVKYSSLYIESVVFYHSLHIHHQIGQTSHFPIFSRPKPGGGVYLWGPKIKHHNVF